MSARTGDWHLLGEPDDPVPGEYWNIEAEGHHYTDVARDIAAQVATLRALADDDDVLKGAYVEGLRETCRDAAHDLDRAHDRFATVGSQLTAWAEDVQTARTQTWTQLQDAQAAQAGIAANPSPAPRPAGAPPLTPTEIQEINLTNSRRSNAEGALGDARGAFSQTMSHYNSRAEEVAARIRSASDDDMKDSRWDKVKGWVDEHAQLLKLIADIIGWIVTIVAVIALFCTPAGWILLLVAAIAVIGLGIRALLAASGNGSWADFLIDLVGVLTLGTGKIATAIAKAGRMATLRVVAETAGSQARIAKVTALLTQFKNAALFEKPAVWLLRSNPVMRWMAGRAAYTETRLAWLSRELPELNRMETVLAGMDDVAGAMRKEIAAINLEFPGLVTRSYDIASNVAVNAGRTGAVSDLVDKVLGDSFVDWNDAVGLDDAYVPDFLEGGKPGFGPYGDFKDRFTYAPGGHLG